MTADLHQTVTEEVGHSKARLKAVVVALGIALSSWYYRPRKTERKATR